ncbi:MAG: GspH/FimT family pseudopilin [Gammaproteobacteria bacterium]|nr:GspH/FimT family pseudopilin [Gammaproteobacteria bacterium]
MHDQPVALPFPGRRAALGFTLIEVMLAIAIAALLVGIGIPGLQQYLQSNRRAAAVNQLVGDIQAARVMSLNEGRNLLLCTGTAETGCSLNSRWENGWILFQDDDGDNNFDPPGEALLIQRERLAGVTIPSNNVTGRIGFRPGLQNVTGNSSLSVCVNAQNEDGRRITIAPNGRPRQSRMDANSNPPNCP